MIAYAGLAIYLARPFVRSARITPLPLAGLIDVAAERERLQKNRQKTATDLDRVQKKLAQESFVANAPPAAVVGKEREKLAALERDVARLDEQLARLATL